MDREEPTMSLHPMVVLLVCALSAAALTACSDDPVEQGAADPNNAANNDAPDANDDPDGDDPDDGGQTSSDAMDEPDLPEEDPGPLPERPWDITERGFYEVGYRTIEVTYTPEGLGEPRTLRVPIWYPSRSKRGESPKYMDILPREGVYEGVSVGIDAPAPVMVFSHGNQGFSEQSFFFTEYFASHGWIVIAPGHTGNTLFDMISPRPPWMFDARPQDLTQTLDELYNLPDDDPLAGLLSEEDVVISGHSYGGYTTLASAGARYDVEGLLEECERRLGDDEQCTYITQSQARYEAGFADERFKVAIPMAPGNSSVFMDGIAQVDIPVLHMTGVMDQQVRKESEGDPIWDWLDGADDLRLQFPRGGHLTFTDSCTLVPGVGRDDGCGDDFVVASEAHVIINAYAMAFARFHLFGDEDNADLLSGQRTLSEEAVLLSK